MDEDLFSVFDQPNQSINTNLNITNKASLNKRSSNNNSDVEDNEQQSTKKTKFMNDEDNDRDQEPVSVEQADDFEQEATREVAANAGLGGGETEEGQISLQHQVRHRVALPPNYPYVPISQHVPPKEPARNYAFTLDPFQRVSVSSIERDESVHVSAHTSAGKTVVAEYAIAQCLKRGERVVYTSPIKVKFRMNVSLASFNLL